MANLIRYLGTGKRRRDEPKEHAPPTRLVRILIPWLMCSRKIGMIPILTLQSPAIYTTFVHYTGARTTNIIDFDSQAIQRITISERLS